MKKLFFLFTVASVAYKIAKRLGYLDNHPHTRHVMDKITNSESKRPRINAAR